MSVEVAHLEKTRPILVLESRRQALIGWLKDGQTAITEAQALIRKHQEEAIEMTDEIAEIEIALNVLGREAQGEDDGYE